MIIDVTADLHCQFCTGTERLFFGVDSIEQLETELQSEAKDQGWHDAQTCGECHAKNEREAAELEKTTIERPSLAAP